MCRPLLRIAAILVFLAPALVRGARVVDRRGPQPTGALAAADHHLAAASVAAPAADAAADAAGELQDQATGRAGPADRPGGRGPGVADLRQQRQPADGGGVRVPAALRRGHLADDAHDRRQGVPGQAAGGRPTPGGCTRRSSAGTATRRCWSGWAPGCSARTSFRCRRGPAAPSRCATPSSAARTGGLTDFLFPLEHGEVHRRGPGEGGNPRHHREPGGDQKRL